ncbi:hypothetical protein TNCV_2254191 [Trichonephila clavipes]|nr:hypothetical protein TNCV_2254191 [Trichonephila clavipes]
MVASVYSEPVAHSTACLRPVRKAFLLIRVSIPGQHHRAKLWDSPLRFLKRSALLFSELFSPLLLVLFFSRSPPVSRKRTLLNTRGVFTTRPSLLLIRRSPKSLDLLLLPIRA